MAIRYDMIPEFIVSDYQKSLAFYKSLGFTIHFERPEQKFGFLLLKDIPLMLHETTNWVTGEMHYPYGRGLNLSFIVKDVEALYVKCKRLKYPIFVDLKTSRYRQGDGKDIVTREFCIQDPDGYLLRFQTDVDDKVEVRRIKENEIAKVHKLVEETIHATWKNYYPQFSIDYVLGNELTLDVLKQRIKTSHFYVATLGDEIVGCAAIEPLKDSKTESWLHTFFVSPNHQGKGIGTALIKALESDEYALRAKRIEVPSSIPGLPFYKKHGYEHKGGELNYGWGQFTLEKFLK